MTAPFQFPVDDSVATYRIVPAPGFPTIVEASGPPKFEYWERPSQFVSEIEETPEFRQWARENDIDYNLSVSLYENPAVGGATQLFIVIPDRDQAILFQTVWQ